MIPCSEVEIAAMPIAGSRANTDPLYSRDGIVATLAEDRVHITLPQMHTEARAQAAIVGLQRIFDRTPPGVGWTVDLSHLESLNLQVVGALVAYQMDLECAAPSVTLEGVREDLGPPLWRMALLQRIPFLRQIAVGQAN